MNKYYIYCDIVGKADELIGATITTMREDTVDLKLDNGARIIRYAGKIYNENGEEVPFEEVERNFLPVTTEALLARIAQLEAMVTGGGTNV